MGEASGIVSRGALALVSPGPATYTPMLALDPSSRRPRWVAPMRATTFTRLRPSR